MIDSDIFPLDAEYLATMYPDGRVKTLYMQHEESLSKWAGGKWKTSKKPARLVRLSRREAARAV